MLSASGGRCSHRGLSARPAPGPHPAPRDYPPTDGVFHVPLAAPDDTYYRLLPGKASLDPLIDDAPGPSRRSASICYPKSHANFASATCNRARQADAMTGGAVDGGQTTTRATSSSVGGGGGGQRALRSSVHTLCASGLSAPECSSRYLNNTTTRWSARH